MSGSTPRATSLRHGRTGLGKLLNATEDSHQDQLKELVLGNLCPRVAMERARKAVDDNTRHFAKRTGFHPSPPPPRWKSLEKPTAPKGRGRLPPIEGPVPVEQGFCTDQTFVSESALSSTIAGSDSPLSNHWTSDWSVNGMSSSGGPSTISTERTPIVYLKRDGTVKSSSSSSPSSSSSRSRRRTKQEAQYSTAMATAGRDVLAKSGNLPPISPSPPVPDRTSAGNILHNRPSTSCIPSPVAPMPTPMTAANESHRRSSDARHVHIVAPAPTPGQSSLDRLASESRPSRPPVPATPGTRSMLEAIKAQPRPDSRLIVPIAKSEHYTAVKKRHQEIMRLKWRCSTVESNQWSKRVQACSTEDTFEKLLLARSLWDEVLEDVEVPDLAAVLSLIKDEYEEYLVSLMEVTTSASPTPSYTKLKNYYAGRFAVKKQSKLSDDPAPETGEAPSKKQSVKHKDPPTGSAVALHRSSVDELESQAADALDRNKDAGIDCENAKEYQQFVDTVAPFAWRWLGKTRGRLHVQVTNSGNKQVLDIERKQRQILDAMATKDGLVARQRRELMTSKSFQALQKLVTESTSECESLERRVALLQHTLHERLEQVRAGLVRYRRHEIEFKSVASCIDRLASEAMTREKGS